LTIVPFSSLTPSPIPSPTSSLARRVVSLLPGATEIIAALGALDQLVGVTHECDHPPDVADRVRVTETAVDTTATPDVVDARVRELARSGAPMFTLRQDRIAALGPDLLLTQALCAVCAVSEHDVRSLAARLSPPPNVVTVSATTLDGVLDDIRQVATALGCPDRGVLLVDALLARLRAVHDVLRAAEARRPRVAVIEWVDPLFTGGHWIPDMVRRAGGRDVLAQPGEHSTTMSGARIAEARPDVIIVAPCGYDVVRAAEAARSLTVPTGVAVWAVDANGLFSRPGPRLVDGVETLATILHPSLFAPPDPVHAVPIRAS
jgi:iron complex transport system substrate-binding protein